MMTLDEAILHIRRDPRFADLVRDAYLGPDVRDSADRFRSSAEFAEVDGLVGARIRGGVVLDLGAGNGIASRAFFDLGAARVVALEPNPSREVGLGAMRRLGLGPGMGAIGAVGERLPLRDATVDVVYARQALHHTRDLRRVARECARVLRRGGVFLACREHVVDDDAQRETFLRNHPVHRLAGGENAFPLATYLDAVASAGLDVRRVWRPWDSVINAFPAVRSAGELERYPRAYLETRWGRIGRWAGSLPGARSVVRAWLNRPLPGRLYSFMAVKM